MKRFKLRLKEERIVVGNSNPVMFEWAKLDRDNYVVYMPKLFTKEPGGSVVCLSEKGMMRMLARHKKTQEETHYDS